MKTVKKWAIKAENAVLIGAFVAMTGCVVLQVVNRSILHLSLPWLEEISITCMVYLVMVGVEAGLRDGSQIRVTALQDALPARARTGLELVVKIAIAAFSLTMAYYSASTILVQIDTGQTTAVLHLGIWVPYLVFPVVFAIAGVVHLVGAATMLLPGGPTQVGPSGTASSGAVS